jgi:hypothetical protein
LPPRSSHRSHQRQKVEHAVEGGIRRCMQHEDASDSETDQEEESEEESESEEAVKRTCRCGRTRAGLMSRPELHRAHAEKNDFEGQSAVCHTVRL